MRWEKLRRLRLPRSVIPVFAVALAFLGGALLIAISGVSPVEAYRTLLHGAFGSTNNIAETLVKASPLILAGLGLAVAFRARVFSIGAEGQIYMGALGAGYIGLFLGDLPPWVGIPLALLAGFITGAVWGGIAGILKLKFEANEVIVTLMMNYIAIEFTNFLVSGPWRDPHSTEPFTAQIALGTRLPILVPRTRLHAGILVALLAAVLLWWIMRNTVLGYQLEVTGANEQAASASGIRIGRVILIAMLMSGGLAGLAGAGELCGIHYRVLEGLSPGYGYTAIVVAVLGRNQPIGVLLAGLLFAALVVGADGMHRWMGVPVAVAMLIQGLVLLFVLGSEVLSHRRVINERKGEE